MMEMKMHQLAVEENDFACVSCFYIQMQVQAGAQFTQVQQAYIGTAICLSVCLSITANLSVVSANPIRYERKNHKMFAV